MNLSPAYKIEEAVRGFELCAYRASNPDHELGFCQPRETPAENTRHANTWLAYILHWAGRNT